MCIVIECSGICIDCYILPIYYNCFCFLQLHSLLLRHLTGSGIALVGLHTAIRADTPLPVPPYLRLCFEHALLQSPACEGTHMCDIVRIARRQ